MAISFAKTTPGSREPFLNQCCLSSWNAFRRDSLNLAPVANGGTLLLSPHGRLSRAVAHSQSISKNFTGRASDKLLFPFQTMSAYVPFLVSRPILPVLEHQSGSLRR